VDAQPFAVVYTTDNWATKKQVHAHSLGRIGCFVDIPIAADEAGSIVFTMHWPAADRWLGRNYEVIVHAIPPAQQPTTEKPKV
jgi:glucoamylase